MSHKISRRLFSALFVGIACDRVWSEAPTPPSKQLPAVAGRKLDFRIEGKFGDASAEDITAVVTSAAESIWTHCPNTRWEAPGFLIYHDTNTPIILYDHRPDGRIAIGLNVEGTHWAQLAYQFAHEFCHALAGHSNDWRKPKIRGKSANHWLEESLCETASLFALWSMGKTWQKSPPYGNWKSFAVALTKYAEERLQNSVERLPEGMSFESWFRDNEAAMRDNSVLREKNTTVARQLLPLFEEQPAGWEALTFLNLGERDAKRSLADHIEIWKTNVPQDLKAFVNKIGAKLGVREKSND